MCKVNRLFWGSLILTRRSIRLVLCQTKIGKCLQHWISWPQRQQKPAHTHHTSTHTHIPYAHTHNILTYTPHTVFYIALIPLIKVCIQLWVSGWADLSMATGLGKGELWNLLNSAWKLTLCRILLVQRGWVNTCSSHTHTHKHTQP